ncbi:hypothetical protein [Bacillus subtilis]|uniref:hypothetical protein n=1 Tax=Bacillus subtilis TaxID=1423 RepID=UPI002078BC17|nr:hypothetical protein [Bacillus subtilis]
MNTYFKGKIEEHNVITDCDIDKVLHKMYLRFGFREYKRNNYEHVFDLLGISAPD